MVAPEWQERLVKGPFWQEPVRVLMVQEVNGWVWVKAEGLHSRQVYENYLTPEQWMQVEPMPRRDGQGSAERAFLALEGRRVRLAYLFDPLLAVNASQIDPLPHQIEAVYHHILRNPRVRFLLADDPGAGKTIMAGLVLKELKYRGLVQRTLIVVPGHLRDQWWREMKEKFGEEFVIVDRAVVENYRGRNIWQELPQVITSMDFAKQEEILNALRESRWDLVIVDEAHKMAAYRYGRKVHRTDRYRLGEALSANTHFLLFLTATPHKGDPENFRLLLELLEPGMFPTADMVKDLLRNRDHPIFIRRLKEDLTNYDNSPLFPPREVMTLCYNLTDEERQLYRAVTNYVRHHYRKAEDKKKRGVGFAMLVLQRRMASSIHALLATLQRRYQRLQQALSNWESFLQRQQLTADEEELEDAPEHERWAKEEEAVANLSNAESPDELQEELKELRHLIDLAEQVARSGQETKLVELRKVLDSEQLRQKGEKLLIFTEAKETMEYLARQLKEWGLTVTTLHGGMNMEERLRAEREFRDRTQVMVSTEAGGEGINLQFCHLMVNYDIPWNPNRLEQRIGRIHRYKQRHKVHVYNLVASDTIEGRIMDTLQRKLDEIRKALGSDRVFDVLGEIVDHLLDGKSLSDLIVHAILNPLTLDDILQQIERVPNEQLVSKVREATLEMLATRHVDLQWVLGASEQAKENRLIPEYIERLFLRACKTLRVTVETRRDGFFRIEWVPTHIRNVSRDFKARFGEVAVSYPRFTFRKELAQDQVEFVAPGHPLLEAIVEKVMALGSEDLQRGACFYDPSCRWDGWLWILEGEIVDGEGTVAGKRLFAVYQPLQGEPILVNPAALWDLEPAPPEANSLPFPSDERTVVPTVLKELQGYLQELKAERERFASVRRKYAAPILESLIQERKAKIAQLEMQQASGERVDLALRMERRHLDELEERLQKLQRSLETETNLVIGPVSVVTVLRVMPLPKKELPEEENGGMVETPELEAIGLQVAMSYEKQQGRIPVDVSQQRLGYDIKSKAPDGSVRYIEVKTRARTGSVALTEHEWLKARQLGDAYWLYVVENAATQPQLWLINNPAAKLEPKAKVVHYIVSDWKSVAQPAPSEGEEMAQGR